MQTLLLLMVDNVSPLDGESIHLTSDLNLEDVLLIPSFSTRLLSIHIICSTSRCHVIFSSTYCVFQDVISQKEIGHGRSEGMLYYLQTRQHATTRVAKSSRNIALQWHVYLGYPNLNKLKRLVPSLISVF